MPISISAKSTSQVALPFPSGDASKECLDPILPDLALRNIAKMEISAAIVLARSSHGMEDYVAKFLNPLLPKIFASFRNNCHAIEYLDRARLAGRSSEEIVLLNTLLEKSVGNKRLWEVSDMRKLGLVSETTATRLSKSTCPPVISVLTARVNVLKYFLRKEELAADILDTRLVNLWRAIRHVQATAPEELRASHPIRPYRVRHGYYTCQPLAKLGTIPDCGSRLLERVVAYQNDPSRDYDKYTIGFVSNSVAFQRKLVMEKLESFKKSGDERKDGEALREIADAAKILFSLRLFGARYSDFEGDVQIYEKIKDMGGAERRPASWCKLV